MHVAVSQIQGHDNEPPSTSSCSVVPSRIKHLQPRYDKNTKEGYHSTKVDVRFAPLSAYKGFKCAYRRPVSPVAPLEVLGYLSRSPFKETMPLSITC